MGIMFGPFVNSINEVLSINFSLDEVAFLDALSGWSPLDLEGASKLPFSG